MTTPGERRDMSDAEYLALFDGFLSGGDAEVFERAFFRLMASDARLDDDERYEILQRVFYGCEDFVADPTLREAGDLDAAGLRTIVAEAARDLRDRKTDWEGQTPRR